MVKAKQSKRWADEQLDRAKRLRKGARGLVDRVTGRRGRAQKLNKLEIFDNRPRDWEEKRLVIAAQMKERQELQQRIDAMKLAHAMERKRLVRELGKSVPIRDSALQQEFRDSAQSAERAVQARDRAVPKESDEEEQDQVKSKGKGMGRKRGQ